MWSWGDNGGPLMTRESTAGNHFGWFCFCGFFTMTVMYSIQPEHCLCLGSSWLTSDLTISEVAFKIQNRALFINQSGYFLILQSPKATNLFGNRFLRISELFEGSFTSNSAWEEEVRRLGSLSAVKQYSLFWFETTGGEGISLFHCTLAQEKSAVRSKYTNLLPVKKGSFSHRFRLDLI